MPEVECAARLCGELGRENVPQGSLQRMGGRLFSRLDWYNLLIKYC